MSEPTALLVSRTSAVIDAVKGIGEVIPRLRIEVCSGGERASARARRDDVALVLAHLTPGSDAGITRLLWSVAEAGRPCATVVLSDTYQEHQMGALLRAGAADYLEVPTELPKLSHLLDTLTRRLRPLSSGPADKGANPLVDTVSEGMDELMEQLARVAPQDLTLLLTGETGTGKTRLARLVHELSGRRHEPFLVVDCGSLSPSLIESELFGHARGAFTGAERERPGKLLAAGAGTLLLDEVNSLPLHLQAKLLRAVDERVFEPVGSDRSLPVRARLIAATNAPLDQEVAARRFRSDLYYRLNVVGLFLPPLRQRRASIPPLARRFLAEFAGRNRPDVTGYEEGALKVLEDYHWPGNVRELRNVIERAVALCRGPRVGTADLPEAIHATAPAPAAPPSVRLNGDPAVSAPSTLHQSKEQAELRRILEALQRNRNNRLRAALELGISRVALYKKLHKYGLMQPEDLARKSAEHHDVH